MKTFNKGNNVMRYSNFVTDKDNKVSINELNLIATKEVNFDSFLKVLEKKNYLIDKSRLARSVLETLYLKAIE